MANEVNHLAPPPPPRSPLAPAILLRGRALSFSRLDRLLEVDQVLEPDLLPVLDRRSNLLPRSLVHQLALCLTMPGCFRALLDGIEHEVGSLELRIRVDDFVGRQGQELGRGDLTMRLQTRLVDRLALHGCCFTMPRLDEPEQAIPATGNVALFLEVERPGFRLVEERHDALPVTPGCEQVLGHRALLGFGLAARRLLGGELGLWRLLLSLHLDALLLLRPALPYKLLRPLPNALRIGRLA